MPSTMARILKIAAGGGFDLAKCSSEPTGRPFTRRILSLRLSPSSAATLPSRTSVDHELLPDVNVPEYAQRHGCVWPWDNDDRLRPKLRVEQHKLQSAAGARARDAVVVERGDREGR